MNAQRLATTFDYEAYAKEILDMQTFEHLQGAGVHRSPEIVTDFDLIKLKALGLMSLANYQGTATSVLGHS